MTSEQTVPEEALRHLLRETFDEEEWTVVKPAHGQQKECYVARGRVRAAFVKFDSGALVAALRRLGELAVAPRVLADGCEQFSGRPYVIWEHIPGEHPSGWRWFGRNLSLLAETVRCYQADPALGWLLAARLFNGATPDYRVHVDQELEELKRQCAHLEAGPEAEPAVDASLAADLSEMLAELARQARQLQPAPLVPVHGDPNHLNLILPRRTRESLLLVDWDDMLLSDPVRDIAQWLRWYVARDQWPIFFARYGVEMNRSFVDRVFWWAARASFANALWHLARRYPYKVFLHDCRDALRQQIVPHQVLPARKLQTYLARQALSRR